jgi:fructose-1-phosphate kinase PfkB-like protein
MIITLTPNPSVDQAVSVEHLVPGTVHRAFATEINPAGKGIHVSRHQGRTLRAIAPQVERRSTVGSGDSMVAGLAIALARGEPIEVGLRRGAAAGAATAMTPGTALGTAHDVAELVPRVQVVPWT